MGDNSGEGLAVLYNSQAAPMAPIASGNSNVVSYLATLNYAKVTAFQINTDGGASVDYKIQMTLHPYTYGQYGLNFFGSATRDDSANSAAWTTVKTGTIASGAAANDLVVVASSCFRDGRIVFTWSAGNTPGTTAKVFAILRTSGG